MHNYKWWMAGFFVCVSLVATNGIAQTQNRTFQIGTESNDDGSAVATDLDGNILVTGITYGALGGTNAGGGDLFVIKLDGNADVIWSRQFGGATNESGRAVATDAFGNIFVAGLQGATGDYNVLLVKYDATGELIWSRAVSSENASEFATGVALDRSGNIYVTGYQVASSDFDAIVRKFDSDGSPIWKFVIASDDVDIGNGVATDSAGNVCVVGRTSGDLEGGNRESGDGFVAKLGPDGEQVWLRQFGSPDGEDCTAIAIDESDNVIIAGTTTGLLGAEEFGEHDAFVAQLDSKGDFIWTTQFGTAAFETITGVSADSKRGYLFSGIGNGEFGGVATGRFDIFAGRIDPNGNLNWFRQVGSSGSDEAWGIANDRAGTAYVVGRTTGELGSENLGDRDIFVLKFSPVPEFAAATSNLDVIYGAITSGGAPQTTESDDQYLKLIPGFTLNQDEAPILLTLDGNVGKSATAIDIEIESIANTPNLRFVVEQFNWNTNTYEVVGSSPERFSNEFTTNYALNPVDHIANDGAVRTRIGWRQNGFLLLYPWEICVDRVVWNYSE